MKDKRPGILSVRSVNEYRRRDTLAYLTLRYYLDNKAARSNRWAREVATDLVLSRTQSPYYRALHFKETSEEGAVEHRSIFLPSANEALAETALLEECVRQATAFSNPPVVFSYPLNSEEDRSGIFRHYLEGLRDRHEQIAQACESCPKGVVQYIDIRRFYPSITTELAARAWREQCEVGHLSRRSREVGEKLIADHASVSRAEGGGVLTGPMFSHLLGNLVLRKIDEDLSARLPVKYFRYVDDITLVGEKGSVKDALGMLRGRLENLGFKLHDFQSPKSIEVSTADWLKGRNDYSAGKRRNPWQRFINNLKLFLLLNPEQWEVVQSAFRSESFRIPVRDYSAVVRERGFVERVMRYAQKYWFRRKAQDLSIGALVSSARLLRIQYERELQSLLDGAAELAGYDRKRRIPQLRWRAGRLIYLAEDAILQRLALVADKVHELYLHSQVMKAVASGQIDGLLPLGMNAAQAAAQPLRAVGKACIINEAIDTDARKQGLAIFLFNGVAVTLPDTAVSGQSEIVQFARSGSDMALMRSDDLYLREIACLHGLSQSPRHEGLLRTVFDKEEELAMDAIEQIQQSASP